jgi:tripartite-type tricarboxylate transporter receptor subunit TctC
MKRVAFHIIVALTWACTAWDAAAQTQTSASRYPQKPVRILQPAPPAGASDVILRIVAQRLSETLGQPAIVDNRPGAHGMIANELAASARPDGYTLLYGTVGTIAINTGLYTKARYGMPDDFSPLTQFIDQPNVIVVNAALPVGSLADLVQLAKAKPGQLSFGSAGSGSATHLGPEMFCRRAGITMRHVPYKGAAAAAVGTAGGEVQVLFVSPVTADAVRHEREAQALAISSTKRVAVLGGVPTIAESGYPGFSYSAWSGMLAPAKTPQPVIAKLHLELIKILKTQELRDAVARDGSSVVWSETPEQFGDFIRSEIAKWGKVIQQTGARVE